MRISDWSSDVCSSDLFSAFRWRFFASGCDASRTLAFLAGDRGNDGANLSISTAFRDPNFRDNPFIDRFKSHGCFVSLDLRQIIAGANSLPFLHNPTGTLTLLQHRNK